MKLLSFLAHKEPMSLEHFLASMEAILRDDAQCSWLKIKELIDSFCKHGGNYNSSRLITITDALGTIYSSKGKNTDYPKIYSYRLPVLKAFCLTDLNESILGKEWCIEKLYTGAEETCDFQYPTLSSLYLIAPSIFPKGSGCVRRIAESAFYRLVEEGEMEAAREIMDEKLFEVNLKTLFAKSWRNFKLEKFKQSFPEFLPELYEYIIECIRWESEHTLSLDFPTPFKFLEEHTISEFLKAIADYELVGYRFGSVRENYCELLNMAIDYEDTYEVADILVSHFGVPYDSVEECIKKKIRTETEGILREMEIYGYEATRFEDYIKDLLRHRIGYDVCTEYTAKIFDKLGLLAYKSFLEILGNNKWLQDELFYCWEFHAN